MSIFLIPLMLVLVGCSKGTSNNSSIPEKKFLAANVLLSSSEALASDQNELVDMDTKIDAKNIIFNLSNATIGRLRSSNLKDALEKEVAPSISTLLSGTWIGKSKRWLSCLEDSTCSTSRIGIALSALENVSISFSSNGTFVLNQGCFSVLDYQACQNTSSDNGNLSLTQGTFEVIGSGSLLMKYQLSVGGAAPTVSYTVLSIASANTREIVLINQNVNGIGQEIFVLEPESL